MLLATTSTPLALSQSLDDISGLHHCKKTANESAILLSQTLLNKQEIDSPVVSNSVNRFISTLNTSDDECLDHARSVTLISKSNSDSSLSKKTLDRNKLTPKVELELISQSPMDLSSSEETLTNTTHQKDIFKETTFTDRMFEVHKLLDDAYVHVEEQNFKIEGLHSKENQPSKDDAMTSLTLMQHIHSPLHKKHDKFLNLTSLNCDLSSSRIEENILDKNCVQATLTTNISPDIKNDCQKEKNISGACCSLDLISFYSDSSPYKIEKNLFDDNHKQETLTINLSSITDDECLKKLDDSDKSSMCLDLNSPGFESNLHKVKENLIDNNHEPATLTTSLSLGNNDGCSNKLNDSKTYCFLNNLCSDLNSPGINSSVRKIVENLSDDKHEKTLLTTSLTSVHENSYQNELDESKPYFPLVDVSSSKGISHDYNNTCVLYAKERLSNLLNELKINPVQFLIQNSAKTSDEAVEETQKKLKSSSAVESSNKFQNCPKNILSSKEAIVKKCPILVTLNDADCRETNSTIINTQEDISDKASNEMKEEIVQNKVNETATAEIFDLGLESPASMMPKDIPGLESDVISNSSSSNDNLEEQQPKLKKSKSLKVTKTPPGTPERKKIVRFADALGLDLTEVKTYVLGCIPLVPAQAFGNLENYKSCDTMYGSSAQGECQKFQPSSCKETILLLTSQNNYYKFKDILLFQKVALENLSVAGLAFPTTFNNDPHQTSMINSGDEVSRDVTLTFTAIIKVLNMAYHKLVSIILTQNNWNSIKNHQCNYFQSSADGLSDTFKCIFQTKLSNKPFEIQYVEFAIKYCVNGTEYWDNNEGKNYTVVYYPSPHNFLRLVQR